MRILKNIPIRYCVHIRVLDLQRRERNNCAVVHNPKEKYVSLFYTVLFTKTQFQTNNDWGWLAVYCLWGWKNILGLENSDCWGIRLQEIWFFKICFVHIDDTKILSYFTWLTTEKVLDSQSHLKCKSKQEVYNNYYWISFMFWCHANLSQWFFSPT